MNDWREGCSVEWVLPWPVDARSLPGQAGFDILIDDVIKLLSVRSAKIIRTLIRSPGRFRDARTIRDLKGVTEDELLEIRNSGNSVVIEITDWLAKMDMAVGGGRR
jgi:hypothetical protein